jgi:DNA-binding transcriptional ArsR family regulator
MTEIDETRIHGVEALKAIAHPLRGRLLMALRQHGPATATELAARFGESSGSTSYHLRQLARYGFVVEDADQPSRRERRWRAAAQFTSWDDADFVDDPAGREASDAMHARVVAYVLRRDRQWRARMADWDRAWSRSAGISDIQVRLTPVATERLGHDVLELARRLEAESADDPAAAFVAVAIQAVPVHPEDLDR